MKIVFSPPNRSEMTPQTCRLAKAVPSRTDSTRAPVARLMPRSPQKATMCCCGMAIGTQQSKPPQAQHHKGEVGRQSDPEGGARRLAVGPPLAGALLGCGGG